MTATTSLRWALGPALAAAALLAPQPARAAVATSGAGNGAIAFASANEEGEDCGIGHDEGVFEPCTFTIYRVAPSGRGQTRLSDCGTRAQPDCGDTGPAWSPTGRRLAYARDGVLAIMHVSRRDGSRAHRVAYDAKHRVGDDVTGEYGAPSWQPLPRYSSETGVEDGAKTPCAMCR